MAGQQSSVGWRLTALLAIFALAVAASLLAPLLLQRIGLAPGSTDPRFFALGLAAAAFIAVLGRVSGSRQPDARALATPAVFRGLALATDTLSAPFFLGLAGAIFAWGHDGLAFALGLGAGILLLQLLIAPVLPRLGARSVPELFALRFGGRGPRFAAALVVAVSMGALLVAQLMAAGLVGARLLSLDPVSAIAVAAAAMLLCFVLRGTTGNACVRGILFPVMLVAFLAPAMQISFERYGIPVPQIAYANALWQIQGLEETLLEQDLADPAVLKPILTPFLSLTPLNFFGLVLGLALGVASLPNLLSRHFMAPTVRSARWSAVWGLLFAALILSAAPALAAYAKLSVLGMIADRTEIAQLPAWVFTYGKLGLVEICGRAATDATAAASACAALPDASVAGSALRLQDLVLEPDMIALAVPEIAGLGGTMLGLLAAAALAAALVTADGPLVAIAGAFGWSGAASGLEHGHAPCALCHRGGSRRARRARRYNPAGRISHGRDLGAGACRLRALSGARRRAVVAARQRLGRHRRDAHGPRGRSLLSCRYALLRGGVLRDVRRAFERRSDRARDVRRAEAGVDGGALPVRRARPPGRRSTRTRAPSPTGGASRASPPRSLRSPSASPRSSWCRS